MELLEWLQKWYSKNCDGYWEHMYGVSIDNIDNPGWTVTIDICETELESRMFDDIRYDNGDMDWMSCNVKQGKFKGSGDPTKLIKILKVFKDWVEA